MRHAPLLLTAALAACGDSAQLTSSPDAATPLADAATLDAPPPVTAACEELNPRHCLLPWPSSHFLVDDATTRTGRRLQLPESGMPKNVGGTAVDPSQFRRFDGFSPATSMLTAYDGDVDPAGLADERHIADSLAAGSPTVILDAESGARIAHFAEIDSWPDIDATRRPLYLRPAARLAERRRYIVAIRGLRHPDGSAIEPSPYFRALRDGTPLAAARDLEGRRAHFETLFAALAAAGVDRASLLEAWDFETASGDAGWGDAVAMRDAALRALAADGAAARCTVTRVEDAPEADVWRRVTGTLRAPLFLNSAAPNPAGGVRIERNPDGSPKHNGWVDLPFLLEIPTSVHARVAAGGAPARLVDYGHGLFGSRNEASSGWFRHHLDVTASVGVAIDWWGMSTDDVARVAATLLDFSRFVELGERLVQGLVHHVVLQRAFRDACTTLPELQIPREAGGSAPAIDATDLYYYGNSQGGIFGLALAGLTIDVTRLVAGVGGMSYSILIPRSTNWQLYGSFMRQGYSDSLERVLLMVMAQSLWDLADPSSFVTHINADPLPCAVDVCPSGATPAHHLLLQIGRDDGQVANVTSEIAARSIGLGFYAEAPFQPYGLTPLSAAKGAPLAADALVIFDIPGTRELPLGTRDPGADTPAHEGVRRAPAAIEQIDRFMRPDGAVVQTCDGVCDPG